MQSRVESMSSCTTTDDTIRVVRIENYRTQNPRINRHPDLDAILQKLGNPGRFQILLFLFTTLNYLTLAGNNLAGIFFTNPPSSYICKNRDFHDDLFAENGTILPAINQQCSVKFWNDSFRNVSTGNDSVCNDWRFPLTENGTEPVTIVTDFDLVCQNRWQSAMASTIYFLGVMAGAAVFGDLGDRFGRKIICMVSSSGAVLLGVATSFTKSYVAFVILRFFLGAFVQGFQVYYSLIMEWFPSERRAFYGAAAEIVWSIGVMYLALIAYFLPNWNELQLALSMTNLVLCVIYFFLLEESLRWLLAENMTQQAADTAARVLRFNKIATELSWEDEHELLSIAAHLRQQEKKATYSFLDLFRTPYLRKVTFCMTFLWLVSSLGYYGLSFNIGSLVGNVNLNLFIGGVLELIPYVANLYIVPKFGCRNPTIIFLFFGGVACVISSLLVGNSRGVEIGRNILSLIGRMSISGAFSAFLVWTAELYPTVIRANGLGICAVALRIAGAVAPQIILLGDYTFKELPIIILGVASLAGVIAAYILPETKGHVMPDTVEAAEEFGLKTRRTENHLRNKIRQLLAESKERIK